MNIFLILSIFSIIWLQPFSCQLYKKEFGPNPGVCEYRDESGWDWQQNRKILTSLNRLRLAEDPQRLRAYVHAYKTSRQIFLDHYPREYEISEEKQEIVQNEFIANPIGEYSLNYKIKDKLRRVETGVFEKSDTGAFIFVVRGLFFSGDGSPAITYKLNNTGFYMESHERIESKYVELAAEAILCGCCAQYGTCSNLCDTTLPVYKDCAPNVSDENLPRIKEQSFSVNTNGSYELRIIFENDFYERTELYELYKEFNGFEVFGLFPYPENPQEDLQYYFTKGELYISLEEFPGLIHDTCLLPLGFRPFIPPPIAIDYSNIGPQLLKGMVG